MPKLLYISNIAGKKLGLSFLGSAMYASQELGYEFHSVANRSASTEEQTRADEAEFGIKLHHIDLARAPYSPKNIKAYKQLCKIIRDEQIDYIHCNTPTGGLLGRLAGKKCKVKKVIYQAHGFHFYKSAPKLNWLVYYPIEKWLAHHTDALITINQEDYELAKNKFHLRNNGQVYYVPGVGIDLSQYKVTAAKELRASIGINEGDIMLISAGDLVERKNYKIAIKAIAESGLKNLKYCICGKGLQLEELTEYAEVLGVENQVLFLGFRSDIKELLQVADIFLFTTKQEGLPRSMMEAMASGLPCVASKVRGNTDLLEDGIGGYLCDVESSAEFAEAVTTSVLAFLMYFVFTPIYAAYCIGTKLNAYYSSILKVLLSTVITVVICYFLPFSDILNTWTGFIVSAFIIALIGISVMWICSFSTDDRRFIIESIKTRCNKRVK